MVKVPIFCYNKGKHKHETIMIIKRNFTERSHHFVFQFISESGKYAPAPGTQPTESLAESDGPMMDATDTAPIDSAGDNEVAKALESPAAVMPDPDGKQEATDRLNSQRGDAVSFMNKLFDALNIDKDSKMAVQALVTLSNAANVKTTLEDVVHGFTKPDSPWSISQDSPQGKVLQGLELAVTVAEVGTVAKNSIVTSELQKLNDAPAEGVSKEQKDAVTFLTRLKDWDAKSGSAFSREISVIIDAVRAPGATSELIKSMMLDFVLQLGPQKPPASDVDNLTFQMWKGFRNDMRNTTPGNFCDNLSAAIDLLYVHKGEDVGNPEQRTFKTTETAIIKKFADLYKQKGQFKSEYDYQSYIFNANHQMIDKGNADGFKEHVSTMLHWAERELSPQEYGSLLSEFPTLYTLAGMSPDSRAAGEKRVQQVDVDRQQLDNADRAKTNRKLAERNHVTPAQFEEYFGIALDGPDGDVVAAVKKTQVELARVDNDYAQRIQSMGSKFNYGVAGKYTYEALKRDAENQST